MLKTARLYRNIVQLKWYFYSWLKSAIHDFLGMFVELPSRTWARSAHVPTWRKPSPLSVPLLVWTTTTAAQKLHQSSIEFPMLLGLLYNEW